MTQVAVPPYDDEGIVADCETGWRRFCAETLVCTHYHIKQFCRRHRAHGMRLTHNTTRKMREVLRRQVAAYRWVFEGAGAPFTFDSVCLDLGLCPDLIRRQMLSLYQPEPDINLLVEWVGRQKERKYANRRGKDSTTRRVGPSIVDAVADLRRSNGQRESRRGAQTHAVCRYQNGHAR